MNKQDSSISEKAINQGQAGRWVALFVFGMFTIVGGVTTYFALIKPGLELMDAAGWSETVCKIESSSVKVSRGESTTYRLEITYTFSANGISYTGDRYDFMSMSSSDRRDAYRKSEELSPGTEVTCYYNPTDPNRSVIDRDFNYAYLLGLFPVIFFVVGLGGLYFFLTYKDRARGISDQAGGSNLQPYTGDISATGPIELKPNVSKYGKFLGALAFALVWNGITSVFVVIAVRSHLEGDPEWFLTIFIIPFVLIGLVGVIGVFYTLLGLLNPRPTLILPKRAFSLGETLALQWRFEGRASRIAALKIALEGREHATYRRGTSTYTDTHKFILLPIRASRMQPEISSGSGSVTIPEDTMPTFKASNNRIDWVITLKGDIPNWPDVDSEFAVTILP